MELEKLAAQIRDELGMDKTANAEAVFKAVKEKLVELKAHGESASKVRKALSLADGTKPDEVVLAINSLKTPATPHPNEYVSMKDHKSALDRVAALEGEQTGIKLTAFREKGEKQGKITTHNWPRWERLYKQDPAQTEKDLETAEIVAPPNGRPVAHSEPRTAAATSNDPILAHSEQFDQAGMDRYQRIEAYREKNKCTFEQAMQAVPA